MFDLDNSGTTILLPATNRPSCSEKRIAISAPAPLSILETAALFPSRSYILGPIFTGSSAVGTEPRKSGVIPVKPSPDTVSICGVWSSSTGPTCFNTLLHRWQIGPSRRRSAYHDGNTDVGARLVRLLIHSRECPYAKSAMRNSQRSWLTTARERLKGSKRAGRHFPRPPLLATVEQLARPLGIPRIDGSK